MRNVVSLFYFYITMYSLMLLLLLFFKIVFIKIPGFCVFLDHHNPVLSSERIGNRQKLKSLYESSATVAVIKGFVIAVVVLAWLLTPLTFIIPVPMVVATSGDEGGSGEVGRSE